LPATIILSVLAIAGALLLIQTTARRELHVATATGRQQAGQIVQGYFGANWTSIAGPGTFNYQPRLREHAPTISITVSGGDAGSTVTIWTSDYDGSYHGMRHAAIMVRAQHALTKRLTSDRVPVPGFLSANAHTVRSLPTL
jgi:hypothetical protein